jgi:glycolate oxidase iron-sulfur subunit
MSKSVPEQIEKFSSELAECIECGNCTFWCPVYQEKPIEEYVARGKNKIIRSLLSGEKEYTNDVVDVLGMCTLCGTCAEHCPVKCKVQSIIIAARADKVKSKGLGILTGLVYKQLIPRRRLFGKIVKTVSVIQKLIMPKSEGKLRHLPLFLSGLVEGRQIPVMADQFLRDAVPTVNKVQGAQKVKYRVGYFMGCATDFIFPEVGKGVINFLTRNGVEVIVPKEQSCCGAPVWLGAGDFETGRKIADENVKTFKDLDFIITNCATCSSAMKDYPKYLADNQKRVEEYSLFAGKIYDFSQFVIDILKPDGQCFKAQKKYEGKTVTWHDPCHLNRYQKIRNQPREILNRMKNINYVEMREAERCCGMAGGFNVYHYDVSKAIADRKAEAIDETKADIIVTGCPGCMIQLTDAMNRKHMDKEVRHVSELLE